MTDDPINLDRYINISSFIFINDTIFTNLVASAQHSRFIMQHPLSQIHALKNGAVCATTVCTANWTVGQTFL